MPKIEMVKANSEPEKAPEIKTTLAQNMAPDFRKYLNIYEFEVELPSGMKVTLKPINAGQLKKFMTSIKEESIQELSAAMYELITTSVVDKDFDIGDIYLNDRPALILELRKISKGTTYQFEYKCPKCKSQSLITEDLNVAKIDKMPEKINPIVKLDDNLSVQIDYVKIKDEQEILNLGLESEAELMLSIIAISVKSIITPEGEQDNLPLKDRIYFTDNIPSPLYEKLTSWHDEFHFGIDLKRKIKCVHCQEESDFTLDADNFFF